ncbi:cell division protein FtsL [Secundilactobacillus kimchicus]|uniref:Cell division protein FtsL n=1 Tax=Secundilactobacillus kimchicus JCM 15530 TaxID=1302272 RepID=A0A0R1HRT9_9LACO|nr:cell division protein FtsL [Secundilactobacillus kimchicus]KRK49550.1 hypothetical protein FC96_GL000482 [Secundilactobacillus kimchicus JCM 15530]MBT9673094.1 cell division protein FtsL [Secundilactobacillus kimchicus]
MAQNNLARQAVPMKPLRVANPERPIHTTTGNQSVEVPKHLALSKFEKCLMTVGTVITMCMMVWLVSLKIGVSTAQQHLQDVNSRIASVQTKNVSTKQEVNELQNRARLDKIAQKDGLSLSNGKIRNVNK